MMFGSTEQFSPEDQRQPLMWKYRLLITPEQGNTLYIPLLLFKWITLRLEALRDIYSSSGTFTTISLTF